MTQETNNQIDTGKVRKGLIAVAILGALAALILIATTFNEQTLLAFKQVDPFFLLYAVGALVVSWIFSGLPFYVLTRVTGKPLGLIESLTVYLAGSFFGFITPFGSGLLPTQVFIMNKEGLSVGQATAVAGARATVSSWLFVVLGLTIYLGFKESLPTVALNVLVGIVILASIWSLLVLFFIKKPDSANRLIKKIGRAKFLLKKLGESRVEHIEQRLTSEVDYLSTNLKDVFSLKNAPAVFLVFVIEVIAWIALFSVLPLVLYGFEVKENFAQLIFRLFILFSLAPVSPTPGGSGIVEIGFSTLLSDLVPRHIIGLVILLWRAITYYLTLIVGGLMLLRFITSLTLKRKSGN